MIGSDQEVRLVDFGLAKDTKGHMKAYAGTPYFMAPEVLNGDYTHKCDIWSVACVLYMMVAGRLPFDGRSREEVFNKIKKGQFAPCSRLSEELQSLLEQMFTVKYADRPTAQECRTHPWFTKMLNHEEVHDESIST